MALTVGERLRGSRRVQVTAGRVPRTDLRESWIVTSDDGSESEEDVYNLAGVPTIDDTWTSYNGTVDPTLQCVSKEVVDDPESTKKWIVNLEFSTELPDNSWGTGQGTDPTQFDPEISWDIEYDNFELYQDRDGVDCVNGAGDPVQPPVVHLDPIWVYRLTRWEPSFPLAVSRQYTLTVNQDAIGGWPSRAGLLTSITGNFERLLGSIFWRVTYVAKFKAIFPERDHPWNEFRLNRGDRFIPAGGGDPKAFIRDGDDGAREGWLNVNGTKAASRTANLDFRVYPFQDWSPLNLFPYG